MDNDMEQFEAQFSSPHGESIRERRTRLGLSVRALAERAGVHRTSATNAEAGKPVQSGTLGRLRVALDQLEQEAGLRPEPKGPQLTLSIEMPSGTQAIFKGDADDLDQLRDIARRFIDSAEAE